MLQLLRIRNLVVVEQTELVFRPGLNVLTGSTGAGKSLILGAMNLLLGHKASPDLIRPGAERAEVEAVFSVSGGEPLFAGRSGGKEVTVCRELRRGGRSHAWIENESVTVRQLGAFCERWIEPHGQNEQFRLKNPESHVEYLDSFAGNAALRRGVENAASSYNESVVALRRFDDRIAILREKQELLEHRLEELERAAIEKGEANTLERELRLMANAEKVFETLSNACAAIYDDDAAAASIISLATRRLGEISGIDERIDRVAEQIESASVMLNDGVTELRTIMDRLEFDAVEMQRRQERLDSIRSLEQRYGMAADELVAMRDEWSLELDGLVFADTERDKLVAELSEAATLLGTHAGDLSQARHDAAEVLDKRMTASLEALMLRGARFRTDLILRSEPGSDVSVGGAPVSISATGADDVRFMVRTNPGQDEGPLDRVASTGEISRIAMALKELVSEERAGGVVVFDEIDAGIGADLGEVIAEKLLALSDRHQIICITHMPQFAARAHHHLVVTKESDATRAAVTVNAVEDEDRRREVARMLGGTDGSEHRMALADEMLRDRNDGAKSARMRP